jgi:hypothetical protein
MAPTFDPQRPCREPLFDIIPLTGIGIKVFYSDRTLETFGRGGAGWFWWSRWRGFPPVWPAYGAVRYELRGVSARDGYGAVSS